jgi:hypothetical protein
MWKRVLLVKSFSINCGLLLEPTQKRLQARELERGEANNKDYDQCKYTTICFSRFHPEGCTSSLWRPQRPGIFNSFPLSNGYEDWLSLFHYHTDTKSRKDLHTKYSESLASLYNNGEWEVRARVKI